MIAIDVRAPDSLEEYDTLVPQARLLNGHADSVAATIIWSTPDTTGVLTILDSLTGKTVVNVTGQTGRLLARSDSLFSNPVSIRTLAAADILFSAGATVDTVTLSDSTPPDSLSAALRVTLADTMITATATDTVPLAGRPVSYAITYAAADSVTLVTTDSGHAPVLVDTVTTNASGIASVKVRLLKGSLPDSIVVVASARRAVGTVVPDSVTFVVRFQP
ncbi:MAG TPA: hypothetical protein VEM13_01655 [Gemmatimonadales bacterium]|nr:hypothetical protein [Gemmatimonadales bacterium]